MASGISILQDIQKEFRYISKEAIEYVSKKTGIPQAQLYGIATFYKQFRLSPAGEHIIKVCHGTACHVAGAENISEVLGALLEVPPEGGTTSDLMFTLETVACLGCCSLAPVIMIDDEVYGKLTRSKLEKIIASYRDGGKKVVDVFGNFDFIKEDLGPKEIERVIVGLGSCGIASGARAVFDIFHAARDRFGLSYSTEGTGCLGMCHREPLVDFICKDGTRYSYGDIDQAAAKVLLKEHLGRGKLLSKNLIRIDVEASPEREFFEKQKRIVLRNCGKIDPESLEDYEGVGGYEALKKVLSSMAPDEVIEEIKKSGLRGRGGAGFSTGLKWSFARKAIGDEKYLVCNADEGDPGAFMDRSILESDPHCVLEGMIIAAYAIGAGKGYIYCRAEYPLALKRLGIAIEQARSRGYLGEKILGSGFDFDVSIKEGAGAFVCGEETALIASLEGRRGMPKIKPPFPASSGLCGMPTNINNVETFANVPWIITNDADKFAEFGTRESKGTKVFALAGDIKRGGLVEVPMGITLHDVVSKIGGGTVSGLPIKAVQLGGPSGGCIPENLMNTKVDYEELVATGAIMGSGGMVVMDERSCMVDIAKFFLGFTQSESCGKCTFCRIGTRRMLEILMRITEGEGVDGDLELLEELGERIKESSLCGLGQTAPNPVLTTIKYFRAEYEAHIKEGRCPAGKCRALISYHIDLEKCIGCGLCKKECPANCIEGELKGPHVIEDEKCTRCGACYSVCPVHAVTKK